MLCVTHFFLSSLGLLARQHESCVECSASDACGGWTSTSPHPKTVVISGEPVFSQSCRLSPSAFEWSFPGRNFTLNV